MAAKKKKTTKTTKKPAAKAAKKPSAKKPAKKTATAKKAAPRMTKKVSPLRGMAVVEYVKTRTRGWQTELMTRLLSLAAKSAPGATVSIKWGQPVIDANGPIAFIKPNKSHVTFGFWRGAELTDAERLEGGDRMRHLKLTSPDGVDEKWLESLVREAVALNKTKGDPTRR
jgi:hypothetical protein